jgi:NADPH:quinone reductase-like Zn-dependent oxidoreductase
MGVSTASCGLYMKDYLALRHPASPAALSSGETLLIWGGSTSVGSNAIQLAVASGYEVFTTCSPRNFDNVKNLGASKVFDYNSASVGSDIIAALEGKKIAGVLAIGSGSAPRCLEIVSKWKGPKFITMASQPYQPPAPPKGFLGMASLLFNMMSSQLSFSVKAWMKGIKTNFIFGSDLVENEVGNAIWGEFLSKALAEGQYKCTPEPEVVGNGLENVQGAMNQLVKGISGKKLVVSL